jgi:hypothetical protein
MVQVTTLKGLASVCQIRYHPFALLNHLDNVRSVRLEEMIVKILPQKFEGESPFKVWDQCYDFRNVLAEKIGEKKLRRVF